MKTTLLILEGILQSFIGIGAVGGGLLLMMKPDGSLVGMPLSMLDGTPFKTFLIPGIILFTVIGLGSMVAGVFSFRRHILSGFAGIFFGLGLMIWIFVQVSMVGGGHWLQNLYFGLGSLELLLGYAIREAETGVLRRDR